MASHASAKKSIRKAAKQRIVNRDRIGKIRTSVKRLAESIAHKAGGETILALMKKVQKETTRGVTKNVLHKNTAARIISKWAHKVKGSNPAA
ncbi:MAG: 30S ribosomal protein S20 [Holosporales bacterium]|jgi:small subunit ribosomal protein S20|nr:30S ribosomal protein S20 [Holosporales bacterium]